MLLILFLFITVNSSEAQPNLIKDYQTAMEIPGITEVASSPAHLYVMSEDEGLSVFRANSDTLQYLYTNSGMQQRGSRISADARYAYLFGDEDNRLTILEPTSVMGIYSSTYLPSRAIDARRIGSHLIIVMEDGTLGHLSLRSQESVDQTPVSLLNEGEATSITGDHSNTYALINNTKIHQIQQDGDTLSVDSEAIELDFEADRLFFTRDQLWASDRDGNLYNVNDGADHPFAEVNHSIDGLEFWNDLYVIRSDDGLVWLADEEGELHEFRTNAEDGNFFTITKSMLWMSQGSEFLQLHKEQQLAQSPEDEDDGSDELRIASIENQVIPQSRVLILPLKLENNIPPEDVRFRYRSNVDNAEIQGKGLYWRPDSRQTGVHDFTIIATARDGRTDSTSFEVDVKRFNSPPRFTPVRPVSIVVDEEYTMPIEARDPDGSNPDLVRYIGVDLPQGADLDESTGEFSWTPHRRQVGSHSFEVIATDQYGAASTLTVDITVKEIDRD